MNKKVLLGLAIIVIAALVTGFSVGIFPKDEDIQSMDWPTTPVKRADIGSTVLATGIIKPMVGAEVRVGSRVSGIVKKLYVSVGDRVSEETLLAEIDSTEFEARVRQAEADLEVAKANLEFAVLEKERQNELLGQELVSQNVADVADRSHEVAEAEVKQAEANLEYARIQLEYTKIRAPISGVVASVSTQEGETVAASFAAPTFVTIIDLNRLEVWAYVDETDIGRIEKGQKAEFTVDTYSDVDFEGKVVAVYPSAEIQDNVVNYVTIIRISKGHGRILRPEMTTTVNIFLEKRGNVLAVPNRAVRRERGRKFVYVLEDRLPVKRWVKVGWKDSEYTEIAEGLEEGENVILGDVTPSPE
jgi:macrolide-specific efflux system membrane fusion protein